MAIPDEVLFEIVDGGGVLVDLERGVSVELNPGAGRIVELLREHGGDLASVRARMLEEFEVLPEQLDGDIERVIDDLARGGWVDGADSTLDPPARAGKVAESSLDIGALASNLRLRRELIRIARALRAAEIDFLVLKGLPLAVRLGRRLDHRAMLDNDVLVRRRDAARACEVLESIGYELPDHLELESQLSSTFQYPMLHRVHGEPVLVEIHWNGFPPTHFRVPEELLWKKVESVAVENEVIPVLSRPLTILQLASHFVQHRLSEPRILGDLGLAWDAWSGEIDVEACLSTARRIGALPALVYSLRAAFELGLARTAPPGPNPMRSKVLSRLVPSRRLLDPRPEHDYARDLAALCLVHPRHYASWLRFHFFPPPDTMAVIHGDRGGVGLYLRYATRPLRPLVRLWTGRRRKPGIRAS